MDAELPKLRDPEIEKILSRIALLTQNVNNAKVKRLEYKSADPQIRAMLISDQTHYENELKEMYQELTNHHRL